MNDSSSDYVVGVISDTHIPDRVSNLHPGLIPTFEQANVNLILHAGDICDYSALDELSAIAPVTVVQGNRDFLMNGDQHSKSEEIVLKGVKIGLMHGHKGLWRYIFEKFEILFQGYRFSNYARLAMISFPNADVIIYGHTHYPENRWVEGKLILNPGSAGLGGWGFPPSFAILRISPEGEVSADIFQLMGARRIKGKWVPLLENE